MNLPICETVEDMLLVVSAVCQWNYLFKIKNGNLSSTHIFEYSDQQCLAEQIEAEFRGLA